MTRLFRALCVCAPAALATLASPAAAQGGGYRCVNESKRINIRAQPMASALDVLSKQTSCPISRDASLAGVRARAVRGTYTPTQALRALVRGTGLAGDAVRQGLQVTNAPHATAAATAAPYDCQNVSLRLDVPAMRLDRALAALSRQTKCPIDRGFEVGGLVSRPLRGTYTPVAGLRAMLEGTGLGAEPVRQGLRVLPAD